VFELYLVPPHLSYQKVVFQLLMTWSSRLFVVLLPWRESTVLFETSILSLSVIVPLVCREGKRVQYIKGCTCRYSVRNLCVVKTGLVFLPNIVSVIEQIVSLTKLYCVLNNLSFAC